MTKKKKVKLKAGDVLSIDLSNNEYAFARVLSKMSIGHSIEVFEYIGNAVQDFTNIDFDKRLMPLQVIDSHSLFWLRKEGNWEIQQRDENFSLDMNETTKFEYGDHSNLTLVSIFGNTETKLAHDTNRYPPYIPQGDRGIKRMIKFWREKTLKGKD